uniref:Uncharacterized protein n=1 Tax=Human betaherpesvirus 6 TaxID=10368 RepID=A0A5P9TQ40_9BETA|nr:hypothetical protein [Human betaherpesvirus 6]QFW23042.1 hypothetical protein [Human betaherpesvirus 6]QFW28011.1 hypothetical protein [Human betaherpesvirus 6]QFW75490.1 hypothetical protein [Human betaherpesvirus 6]
MLLTISSPAFLKRCFEVPVCTKMVLRIKKNCINIKKKLGKSHLFNYGLSSSNPKKVKLNVKKNSTYRLIV